MNPPTADRRFIPLTLVSLAGPLAWAAHFGAVYGGQHVACETDTASRGMLALSIGALTVLAIGLLVFVLVKGPRLLRSHQPAADQTHPFLIDVSRGLIILSVFAILATALAAFILPACAAMR